MSWQRPGIAPVVVVVVLMWSRGGVRGGPASCDGSSDSLEGLNHEISRPVLLVYEVSKEHFLPLLVKACEALLMGMAQAVAMLTPRPPCTVFRGVPFLPAVTAVGTWPTVLVGVLP